MSTDLLLSSGFLAFARHVGFLRAVDECGVDVGRVYGTSSGALVGALYAAGHRPDAILAEVCAQRPIDLMRLARPTLWSPSGGWSLPRGVFELTVTKQRLSRLLPQRFSELPRPFAAGVCRRDGSFHFVDRGPLVDAVLASCSMPWVFTPRPVEIDGAVELCWDGGAVDRLGLGAWRAERGDEVDLLVHLIDRSAGARLTDDLAGLRVVRSERSGASFWRLPAPDQQAMETHHATSAMLAHTRLAGAPLDG